MHSHPLTRLTPISRERLIRQHIEQSILLHDLAVKAGISLRTAYKWLARFRQEGSPALADRRSVRRTQRRTLDPQQLQRAVDLQHEHCTLRRIAKALTAPLATDARVLKALGLGRVKNLEPAEPVRRYQWAQPGDMIHIKSNSSHALSGSATGSLAIGVSVHLVEPVMKRLTWQWMTPPGWPTWKCSQTRSKQRQ